MKAEVKGEEKKKRKGKGATRCAFLFHEQKKEVVFVRSVSYRIVSCVSRCFYKQIKEKEKLNLTFSIELN